ncbi:hypothetical protein H1R82_14350 [Thermoactinomyces intermedius]|jgi:hypothetical protein|uniref:Prophage pi2 protein 40 n=1 Tax=Thermoactinomyces intermedius TaxID=2024 RepID=A0A8I1DH16_THEIN|nr:hypothetical protein [Thermoactinomyces intermedius]MBA4548917.1 hypothetical protein [Thermoactinomyces intermedius]MBA4837795.1 hypothetical protein [Thermoactinomyces intermedius]MBH8596461.1 hypothetical protein [Thermoactinomyces intermedius]
MEKTVTIDGKEVRLKATAALPIRYKSQFGRDFFSDILKLLKLFPLKDLDLDKDEVDQDALKYIDHVDFEVFYNLIWTMAKNADKSIPDPETWFDQFDMFSLEDVLPDLFELLEGVMGTKKKTRHQHQKSR